MFLVKGILLIEKIAQKKTKAAHLVWTAFFCDQKGVASRWLMRDTTETPKGDLSVDASDEPKGSHPSATKKDPYFYKCRSVGGSEGIRKERSDGIAQRSGASRVVNNHFCDNSGWHTNRRKRKAAHLVWTAFFCDQNGVASRWRKRRDSNPCTDCSVTAFRVRAVITTSIRFHILLMEASLRGWRSLCSAENHFDTLPYFV